MLLLVDFLRFLFNFLQVLHSLAQDVLEQQICQVVRVEGYQTASHLREHANWPWLARQGSLAFHGLNPVGGLLHSLENGLYLSIQKGNFIVHLV